MLYFLLFFIISYFIMAMAEYWLHRLVMHKPLLNNIPGMQWVFKDHSIEHHHNERNDMNIDLPISHHIIIGSPLLILAFLYSLYAFLALLLVMFLHSYFWTHLHRGIHDLENNWIMKYFPKWYNKFKQHHLYHHKRPGKNFGVVFLWTDKLFGTKYEY